MTLNKPVLVISIICSLVVGLIAETLSPSVVRLKWSANEAGSAPGGVAIGNERSYVAGSNGLIACDDRGIFLWSINRSANQRNFPALHHDRTRVYFGYKKGVLCAAETGKIIWDFTAITNVTSVCVLQSGSIVACNENTAFLLSSQGELIWTTRLSDGLYGPAVAQDSMIVVKGGNRVVALSATDGSKIWTTAIGYTLPESGIALTPGKDIIVTGDSKLVCLGSNGELKWSRGLASMSFTTPVVDRAGRIVAASWSGEIACFSAIGDELWRLQTGFETYTNMALDSAGSIFIAQNAKIRCFDKDGQLLWDLGVGHTLFCTPLIDQKTLYVNSGDPPLVAFSITTDDGGFWSSARGDAQNTGFYSEGGRGK